MHGGGLELTLVFLLAAVAAVLLFKRFGLGAVLVYLATDVLLGPYGLEVVRDADRIKSGSCASCCTRWTRSRRWNSCWTR